MKDKLLSIIEIISEDQVHDSGLLVEIKDYLNKQLKRKLEVTQDSKNNTCLMAYDIDDSELDDLNKAILDLKKYLSCKIKKSGDKSKLTITHVDPALVEGKQDEIKIHLMDNLTTEMQKLEIKTTSSIVEQPNNNVQSMPHVSTSFLSVFTKTETSSQSQPIKTKGKKQSQLTKEDLEDLERMRKIILNDPDPGNIKFKDTRLSNVVLTNFSKYKPIAEILMYDFILLGKYSDLRTVTDLKCNGTVKTEVFVTTETQYHKKDKSMNKPFFVFGSSDEDSEIKHQSKRSKKTKDTQESYSYLLTANFDLASFVAHFKAKSQIFGMPFLAFEEEVKKCLEYVCGTGSSKTKVILEHFAKIGAYKTMDYILA